METPTVSRERLWTHDEMVADPEAWTIEVLTLEEGCYRLAGRFQPGDVAPSQLLPGFEIEVNTLLGESS